MGHSNLVPVAHRTTMVVGTHWQEQQRRYCLNRPCGMYSFMPTGGSHQVKPKALLQRGKRRQHCCGPCCTCSVWPKERRLWSLFLAVCVYGLHLHSIRISRGARPNLTGALNIHTVLKKNTSKAQQDTLKKHRGCAALIQMLATIPAERNLIPVWLLTTFCAVETASYVQSLRFTVVS
ncbi:14-3-3-like protein [Platysternon megacephalum]|uniref:14-3-3-like protein n=1 Tax=Platysternon megacephalum TaxID=55544 RepID=A0A4D9DE28_9SAUR|nr:14-3-3-like protein [Platysternon megacephalum]